MKSDKSSATLYDDYCNNINDFVYYGYVDNNPMEDFDNPDNSYQFIKDYFKAGRKDSVFTLNFNKELKTTGKHQHTVALYFLGCKLYQLIDHQMKQFVTRNHKNTLWYDDFKYTWFLTCLYHAFIMILQVQLKKQHIVMNH